MSSFKQKYYQLADEFIQSEKFFTQELDGLLGKYSRLISEYQMLAGVAVAQKAKIDKIIKKLELKF